MNTYEPKPADTKTIVIPDELVVLTEKLALNAHENWALQRISDGWTYGIVRDDSNKKHPCLVSYDVLPESEKDYDRITAMETVKLILKLGFKISKY